MPRFGAYEAWTSCPRYGFGEYYWGIREPEFTEDATYVHRVIDSVASCVALDRTRVYFLGHSNGGIFACSAAVKLGNTFAAVGISMGGWRGHMDPTLGGYVEICEQTRSSLPIVIVTGDGDSYFGPCERARDIFSSTGHPVEFHTLINTPHKFQPRSECIFCEFFFRHDTDGQEFWAVLGALCGDGCSDRLRYYRELCRHLSAQPLLLGDLCFTALHDRLPHDLRDECPAIAGHVCHLLTSSHHVRRVDLGAHPGLHRYLWSLVEDHTVEDDVRDCIANLLSLSATAHAK